MTKSTGIIMSGDHPVKCLDGTKTVTRRTWGLEKINAHPEIWEFVNMEGAIAYFKHPTGTQIPVKCPYGGVGDLLWMKETYSTHPLHYRADGYELKDGEGVWHSSMFMPRRLSRADLEIIPGLRPERLQAITEEDAIAEGCPGIATHKPYPRQYRDSYEVLWDLLNAKRGYAWDGNHWIWRIPFKLQG